MHKMTIPEKCEAILKDIVRRCNLAEKGSGESAVEFAEDWGGNALMVHMDGSHTHVGYPGCSFDDLIDQLHERLVNDKGLSLAIPLSRAVRVKTDDD